MLIMATTIPVSARLAANRKINAFGQNDDHLAQRQKNERRSVIKDTSEIGGLYEGRKPIGNDRQQNHDHSKEQRFS